LVEVEEENRWSYRRRSQALNKGVGGVVVEVEVMKPKASRCGRKIEGTGAVYTEKLDEYCYLQN
jgi:hypothetical protein